MTENAYQELLVCLNETEKENPVIIKFFSNWGFDCESHSIPEDVLMSLDEAKKFMQDWSFYGGYGAPDCPNVYIWSCERVFYLNEYDGSTHLDSIPRNPLIKG